MPTIEPLYVGLKLRDIDGSQVVQSLSLYGDCLFHFLDELGVICLRRCKSEVNGFVTRSLLKVLLMMAFIFCNSAKAALICWVSSFKVSSMSLTSLS
jgi:hypothetical protein